MRRLALLWASCAALGIAAAPIAPFSAMSPGALQPPWRETQIARVRPAELALVNDAGVNVLRMRSESAAGGATLSLDEDARAASVLLWRWKVDRVVDKADMTLKAGDDYAARVYVFFDVPMEDLSFAQWIRIRIARALYGSEVPAAAICYVWDNRHPVGTTMPNAYTERVRMIVLESGATRAATWVEEARDVAADYRSAFGLAPGAAVPRVSGIAASVDTDQTGESVTAWFGDFTLGPRP